jgi:hypothetical protein
MSEIFDIYNQLSALINKLIQYNKFFRQEDGLVFLIFFIPFYLLTLKFDFKFKLIILTFLITILSIWQGNTVIIPLIFVFYFILFSCFIGKFFLKFLKINKFNYYISFLIGAGLIGTFINFTENLKIHNFYLYFTFLILIILIKVDHIKNNLRSFFLELKIFYFKPKNNLNHFLDCLLLFYIFLSFLYLYNVDGGYDAVVWHTFIPHQFYALHNLTNNYYLGIQYFNIPLSDYINSFAYVITHGNLYSIKLVNYIFYLIQGKIIYDLAKYLKSSDTGAKISVLLFFSTSVVFSTINTNQVDIAWSCYLTLSIFLLYKTFIEKDQDYLKLFILFFGFAISTKLISLIYVFILIPLFFFLLFKNLKKISLVNLVPVLLFSLFIAFYKNVKSFFITGNPFFPYFNGFFRSDGFVLSNFKDIRWNEKLDFNLLLKMTFYSDKFLEGLPGSIGFSFLLLIPVIYILIKSKEIKIFIFLILSIFAVYLTSYFIIPYIRYFIPALAIICSIIGVVLFKPKNHFFFKGLCFLVIFLNTSVIHSATWYSHLGKDTFYKKQRKLLYEDATNKFFYKFINNYNYNNANILLYNYNNAVGLNSRVIQFEWYAHIIRDAISNCKTSDELKNILEKYQIRFVIINSSEILKKESREFERYDLLKNSSISLQTYKNLDFRKFF